MILVKKSKRSVSKRSRYPRPSKPATPRRPTLLLVDDDVHVLRVSTRILGGIWQVKTARSAEEAATILESAGFDAILTDYEMIGRNGIWLLDKAAQHHPRMRRVLYSGSQPDDLHRHLKSGLIHSFVPKPASRATLVESLTEAPRGYQYHA